MTNSSSGADATDRENELHECPLCGAAADDVSWQTANHQEVCGNDECPINTWDPSVRWIEYDCVDCEKHVSRPERSVDAPGLKPRRCGSCTLEAMARQ